MIFSLWHVVLVAGTFSSFLLFALLAILDLRKELSEIRCELEFEARKHSQNRVGVSGFQSQAHVLSREIFALADECERGEITQQAISVMLRRYGTRLSFMARGILSRKEEITKKVVH